LESSLKPSYLNYPRSSLENLQYRGAILQHCQNDPAVMADVKALCKKDIIFWIDTFCWTKDPRRIPDILPFICYDAYQPETILRIQQAIDDQFDILGEKSRDMGFSWMVLYVFQHKWLYEDGSDFRVGSRKEEFVDKPNDIDTLFGKLNFNFDKQPGFLKPVGYDARKHCAYMRMINPENGNAIIGESANPHFGSGGRRKAVLLDEFSKWDDSVSEAAWTATADVTRCRIPISTPLGSGNKFAVLAKGTKEKIAKITMHWTLHPDKAKGAYYIDGDKHIPIDLKLDPQGAFKMWLKLRKKSAEPPLKGGVVRSPWYDAECDRRKKEDIAQELDINYKASGYPYFDIEALGRQRVWEYIKRRLPTDSIPYGKYIKANLVEVDNKIEVREIQGGWLKIYEMPIRDYQYVLSADTSEGLAKGDEAFGVVRDKWTRNVVAVANGAFEPDDWAVKIQKIGQYYNKAITAPENNNHGYSVCSDLKTIDCNLYWTRKISPDGKITRTKAGFTTTSASRPQMLDQLEEEIRKEVIELRDEDILTQCETFVKDEKTGKAQADGLFLDDGVIATAIGGVVIQEHPYKAPAKKRPPRGESRKKNAGFSFSGKG